MGEVDEELEELLADEDEDETVEPEDHVVSGHPSTQSPSFEEVVDEVRRGLWGKGQVRRLALAQAGFNHIEVEKAVLNKINKR